MTIDDADKVLLGGQDVEAELLADWRIMFGALHARFATGDFATGLRLVDGIGAEAEEQDHHPDLDLRYPHLDVRLSSHDVGGVTQRDVRLARRISDLAAGLGTTARTSQVQVLELALDTHDDEEIKPFWKAVLDLEESAGQPDELRDLRGALPTVWFQQSQPLGPDEPEPEQRWHLDVRVPPEVAEQRLAAALAAGGTLVSDEMAPRFWVVADPQGNKACITTWVGRG
jgi:4a-hydroxytetrahydrobiopterin dehydratase